MMKKIGTMALAALITSGTGCVSLGEYKKLERRFAAQESYVNNNKNKLREMERREQSLTLRASEQEKQLDLYRARLEKSERLRQRLAGQLDESQAALSLAASAPRPEPTPQPIEVMGLQVNPATQGLILETGVMFPAGRATLSAQGKQILDRVKAELNTEQYADKRIRIDGHTDDTPIKRSGHKSNWDLSSKRALAVLHYFEKGGVASDRLSFGGFGPHMPLVSGSTKEAKAKNRRVEIVLVD